MLTRRNLFTFCALSGLAASAGSLSACSGVGGGDAGASGSTTVRYAWWGTAARQTAYTKAIDAFKQHYAAIGVEPEFAEYTAYQVRMTTQMAAKNVAEVFWIPSAQVLTYAKNGLYRNLDDVQTLKWEDYSKTEIEGFKLDGKLNTLPFGTFTPVFRYSQTYADAAGLTLPADGAGWTWDSLAELAVTYAKNNKDKRWAFVYNPDADLPFEAWLRQHGEQLWTQDGKIGFTADTTAAWFDWWLKLVKAGAVPTPAQQNGMAPLWATIGKSVLGIFGNSNHIIDDAKSFPDQKFTLRHVPVMASPAAGHQFLYFPRVAMYANTDKVKVEAAGQLMNQQGNVTDFLKIVGMTMGAPTNPRVAKEAEAFATDNEKQMLKIVADDRGETRKPRYEAPAGTNSWRAIMARTVEALALGQKTPQDAAKGMISEIQTGIDRA